MASFKERVLALAEPTAAQMGLELVDVENLKMGKSRLMRIYVDCEGGIDMNRCEAFHRAVVDALEEIDYDYLEVSSPGDRPLKTDRDFARLRGREVEVRLYAAREGKKLFVGTLGEKREEDFDLTLGQEEAPAVFKMTEVSSVKPYFSMDI